MFRFAKIKTKKSQMSIEISNSNRFKSQKLESWDALPIFDPITFKKLFCSFVSLMLKALLLVLHVAVVLLTWDGFHKAVCLE